MAPRLLTGFLVVAIFGSMTYFMMPLLSESLSGTWIRDRALANFVLSILGFSMAIFVISGMYGLIEGDSGD